MGKILVVDDNAAFRLTTARILREAGHEVDVAADGQQCLERFRASPFDIVIMDIYMPGKEGLETLVELRKEFPHVSVVVMSGHLPVDLNFRAAKILGAIRVLVKPFEEKALLALVAEELDWVAEGINWRSQGHAGR